MAPVILLLSWSHLKSRHAEGKAAGGGRRIRLTQAVPLFVLGFLGMVVLNSLGLFAPRVQNVLLNLSQFLLVMALAGVGLETHVGAMRKIGLRPFYAGLFAAAFMAVVSFTLITVVGIR